MMDAQIKRYLSTLPSSLLDEVRGAARTTDGITIVWHWMPTCDLPQIFEDCPMWHVQIGKYSAVDNRATTSSKLLK
jgi:hypothetical protein